MNLIEVNSHYSTQTSDQIRPLAALGSWMVLMFSNFPRMAGLSAP